MKDKREVLTLLIICYAVLIITNDLGLLLLIAIIGIIIMDDCDNGPS